MVIWNIKQQKKAWLIHQFIIDESGTNGGRTHLLCHKNTGKMAKDTTKVIFIYLLIGQQTVAVMSAQ